MSSDYITRLRHELLRAGAAQHSRWRPARAARVLRPLAAAAVVVVLALAVTIALPSGGDETSVGPAADSASLSYHVEPVGAVEQTAEVMRARLAAAGIDDAQVSIGSGASLTITAPDGARADVAALTAPGRLAIYDWERSVIGPDRPVTRSEALARAASRPDGRVVRDIGDEPESWYALAGEPALTGADVASATAGVDEVSDEPVVELELTTRGQAAFGALTRALAERGSSSTEDAPEAYQHLAIVLDDGLLSLPYVNFHEAPDGIDDLAGAQISGGLTPETARQIAAILSAGPLPAALTAQSG